MGVCLSVGARRNASDAPEAKRAKVRGMSHGEVVHRLDLHDRGAVHRHRWAPRCSCGWLGVFRRRRKEAVEQFHQHRDAIDLRVGAHGVDRRIRPMPLTPRDKLPELLR